MYLPSAQKGDNFSSGLGCEFLVGRELEGADSTSIEFNLISCTEYFTLQSLVNEPSVI